MNAGHYQIDRNGRGGPPHPAARGREFTALNSLLSEALRGTGRVAWINGPLASGKTELLNALAQRAAHSGALTLTATCSAQDQSGPLGVISQLLLSGGELPIDPAASGSGSAEDISFERLRGLAGRLHALADRRAVVLAIDDVQHADEPSLRCLLELVRRSRSAPLLVAFTECTTSRVAHSVPHIDLLSQPHAHCVQLAGLSEQDTADFLAAYLGPATATRLARRCLQASGGSPLLIRALVEDYRIAEAGGFEPAAGEIFRQAVLRCLRGGHPQLREVGRAVALLGDGGGSSGTVSRLLRIDHPTTEWAIEALTAIGLLRDGLFRHPAAREAVLSDPDFTHRGAMHGAAYSALNAAGAGAVALAEHIIAGQVESGCATLVLREAAEDVLATGDVDQALRYLEHAYGICADDRQRAEILVLLARMEWRTNPVGSTRRLVRMVAASRAGLLSAADLALLARAMVWHGRTREAREVLARARGAHHGPGPASTDLLVTELWLTCTFPSLADASNVPDDIPPFATCESMLPVTAALASAIGGRADETSTATAEGVLDRARDSDPLLEPAQLALQALLYAGHTARAAEWCDRYHARASAAGATAWEALFAAIRAEISLRQGDMLGAEAQARAAMTLIPPRNWGISIGSPLSSVILALVADKRYDEAVRWVEQCVPKAMFASRFGVQYQYARGQLLLATRRPNEALDDFLGCGESLREWGLQQSGLVPWRAGAAEACLRLHDPARARDLVTRQLRLPSFRDERARGTTLRVLAATHPPHTRRRLLEEAVDLLDVAGDVHELARALGSLGHTLKQLGQNGRARVVLERAARVRHGRGTARTSTALVPERPPGAGVVHLTNAEHRVARLAALGHTNRDIATQLSVTPSTVEQHLTRVYRKLNVKRRRDLPTNLRALHVTSAHPAMTTDPVANAG
ncbi:AAA family ATPase [Streptomyces profundus]|uniref:AAA family ATPase n=1 Tax=Streptomyces profundus TaxID=2867410 RepID=UPI001D16A644|nr:LuxR family transcriptional regulator [Streptomyces sp. MA3_2.13]UED87483.1 AAA family ATPase [Streptomyces sp. MA3_2.13]